MLSVVQMAASESDAEQWGIDQGDSLTPDGIKEYGSAIFAGFIADNQFLSAAPERHPSSGTDAEALSVPDCPALRLL